MGIAHSNVHNTHAEKMSMGFHPCYFKTHSMVLWAEAPIAEDCRIFRDYIIAILLYFRYIAVSRLFFIYMLRHLYMKEK